MGAELEANTKRIAGKLELSAIMLNVAQKNDQK